VYVLFGLSYETQLTFFRIAIWVVPALLFVVTRRVCRELQHAEAIEEQSGRAAADAAEQEESMRARGEPVA
jgi:hypothetical protein